MVRSRVLLSAIFATLGVARDCCVHFRRRRGLARMRQNENLFCKGQLVATYGHLTDGVSPANC